jgi:hypothetical protein
MARPIGASIRCSPTLIYGQVLRRIPTVSGKVAAATEGDGIIDDQDLLMVSRTRRMYPIYSIAEPFPRQPSSGSLRSVAALDRERPGHVPDQDVNMEAGALREEAPEEVT